MRDGAIYAAVSEKLQLKEMAAKDAEIARLRTAVIASRQYVKMLTGSWWNNREACDLMTKHLNPALGLDPWDGNWIELPDSVQQQASQPPCNMGYVRTANFGCEVCRAMPDEPCRAKAR